MSLRRRLFFSFVGRAGDRLAQRMIEVLSLLWGSFVMSLSTYWIVRADEGLLYERGARDAIRRTWPLSSFWSAVVLFPGIAILVHYWRTRGFSRAGTALGLTLFLALLLGTEITAAGLALAHLDASIVFVAPLSGAGLALLLQRSPLYRRLASRAR